MLSRVTTKNVGCFFETQCITLPTTPTEVEEENLECINRCFMNFDCQCEAFLLMNMIESCRNYLAGK